MKLADSLFTELKRRNVIKVGVAYLAGCWLFIEVAGTLIPMFDFDESVLRLIVIILAIGLIPVLIFSWVFEITPEGLKKESEITPEESIAAHTGQKLNFIIIGLLVITAGYFIYESRFTDDPESVVVTETISEKPTVIEEIKPEPEGISIAVLAFDDMSHNNDKEYFSDGISEEILNVLAQIPALHVTSKSSSFAFKGKAINLTDVAKKLEVQNILEGSVRTAGNRIRITAQLISAGSDKHLWSDTYDRELTIENVFEIQDEISNAIVSALKIHLLKDAVPNINKPNSLDAYNSYLIGLEKLNRLTEDDLIAARDKFSEVISLDPEFAPAYAQKAYAWLLLAGYSSQNISKEELDSKIIPLLNQALQRNPNLPEAVAIQGRHHFLRNRYEEAKKKLDKAIRLKSNYALAYFWRSRLHKVNAQYLDMLSDTERAYELNPMDLNISSGLADDYMAFWRPKDADKIVARMQELHPNHPMTLYSRVFVFFQQNKHAEALPFIEQGVKDNKYSPYLLTLTYSSIEMTDKALAVGDKHASIDILSLTGNHKLAEKYIAELLAKEPESDDYSFHKMRHYLTINNLKKLRFAIDDYISVADSLGEDWRNECIFELILAKQLSGSFEGVESMITRCRTEKIGALEAGYLCACTWQDLVKLAIVEGRIEDAVTRTNEWLDYGGSTSYIKNNPFFTKLKEHPEYSKILKRNNEQIARQQAIYAEMTSTYE